MPEYLAPGVYVEEVDTGSKPIEGVSTSTAGFVGMTVRGATAGLPTLVTSFSEFVSKFGGYLDLPSSFAAHTCLPYAVDGFFTNGGKRLYIMRVVGSGASQASTIAKGGLITRLREDFRVALQAGSTTPGVSQTFKTSTLRGIKVGTRLQFRMIKEGVVQDSPILTVVAVNCNNSEITANSESPTWTLLEFISRYTTVFTDVDRLNSNGEITNLTNPTSVRLDTITIKAKDVGSWGKKIIIQASPETAARAELDSWISGVNNDNKIRLRSTAGFYPNAWIEIDRGNTKFYRRVKAVDGSVLTLEGPAIASDAITSESSTTTTIFSSCEFRLFVSYNGVIEQFGGLTLEDIPGRYVVDVINNASDLISIDPLSSSALRHPFAFPSGGNGIQIALDTGGSDGNSPNDNDYRGTDPGPGSRTGIKALEDIDQISIIAAPGIASQPVQNALISQCELLKDRFAILDPLPKSGSLVTSDKAAPNLTDIKNQRNLYDTKYAAIYYPRLRVYDLLTKTNISVPPSGHIAGIYARSDIERGVHKAPANEVIRGITGLELMINKEEQEILNPSPLNINVLRDFRSAGRNWRVWGARVITSGSDWKYVNVRRLFIFIEKSIDRGTQWVVFEPNNEVLWQRVKTEVTAFLRLVWSNGALMGRTPEEAFFVRCDRTIMTQNDIDNGRLIIQVGIAPVKPAEFVIFRIGQWTGGSSVEEG